MLTVAPFGGVNKANEASESITLLKVNEKVLSAQRFRVTPLVAFTFQYKVADCPTVTPKLLSNVLMVVALKVRVVSKPLLADGRNTTALLKLLLADVSAYQV